MPLPAVPILAGISNALRLPALIAFFTQMAAVVFGYLAARIGPALARNATVLAAIVAATGVAFFAVQALYSALNIYLPSFMAVYSMLKPDSFDLCVSTIFSARFINWLFQWKWFAIERMAKL